MAGWWIIADGSEARCGDRVIVRTPDGERVAVIAGVDPIHGRPIVVIEDTGARRPVFTADVLRRAN